MKIWILLVNTFESLLATKLLLLQNFVSSANLFDFINALHSRTKLRASKVFAANGGFLAAHAVKKARTDVWKFVTCITFVALAFAGPGHVALVRTLIVRKDFYSYIVAVDITPTIKNGTAPLPRSISYRDRSRLA